MAFLSGARVGAARVTSSCNLRLLLSASHSMRKPLLRLSGGRSLTTRTRALVSPVVRTLFSIAQPFSATARPFSSAAVSSGSVLVDISKAGVVAACLWALGDFIGQQVEKMRLAPGAAPHVFEVPRFVGATINGAVMGGLGGYLWYRSLDKVVVNFFKMVPGSARFVAAKVALEFIIWHPFSLYMFWNIVGTCEGHSQQQIQKELQKEFLPTLGGEYLIWCPLDVFLFWKVPLQYQVIFTSAGSLIEAVYLSLQAGHSKSDLLDMYVEPQSLMARNGNAMLRAQLNAVDKVNLALDEFDALDTGRKGYLIMTEFLASKMFLPGITDAAVNAKVLSLLMLRMDDNHDGRLSRAEYARMFKELQATECRHALLIDVVLALFGYTSDDVLSKSEIASVIAVYSNNAASSQELVTAVYAACDKTREGLV